VNQIARRGFVKTGVGALGAIAAGSAGSEAGSCDSAAQQHGYSFQRHGFDSRAVRFFGHQLLLEGSGLGPISGRLGYAGIRGGVRGRHIRRSHRQWLGGLAERHTRHFGEHVKVRAYHAGSLLDNFEWLNGFSARFGLMYVDFTNAVRTRTVKNSGKWYARVAATNSLTP
jgi:Glycosyl hydrolase family 1